MCGHLSKERRQFSEKRSEQLCSLLFSGSSGKVSSYHFPSPLPQTTEETSKYVSISTRFRND
jgi:hypothetical protein